MTKTETRRKVIAKKEDDDSIAKQSNDSVVKQKPAAKRLGLHIGPKTPRNRKSTDGIPKKVYPMVDGGTPGWCPMDPTEDGHFAQKKPDGTWQTEPELNESVRARNLNESVRARKPQGPPAASSQMEAWQRWPGDGGNDWRNSKVPR